MRPGPALLAFQLVFYVLLAVMFTLELWVIPAGGEYDVPPAFNTMRIWLTVVFALLPVLMTLGHFAPAAWLEGPVLARRTWIPVRRVDLRDAELRLEQHQFVARGRHLKARDPRTGKRVTIPLDPFARGLFPADDLFALAAAVDGAPRSPVDGYHGSRIAAALRDLATNPETQRTLARQRRTTTIVVAVLGSVVIVSLVLGVVLALAILLLGPP